MVIDKFNKEVKGVQDSETSYLPLILLLFTLLVIVVGFIIYLSLGKISSFCAQVDSLRPIVLKYTTICLAIYAIPLIFASRTPYQVRRKATVKIIVVYGLMAVLGFYLLCAGIISYLNVKLDKSLPAHRQATVEDAYYSSGSKNKSGYYVIVIQIDGSEDKLLVRHHDALVQRNLGKNVAISVFEGYFNKRWLRIEPAL